MIRLIAILMVLAAPSLSYSQDLASLFDVVEEIEAGKAEAKVSAGGPSDSRLDDIERRLEELERTSIDAKEAEEIAERVVQSHIKEIRLAVRLESGGQRSETVKFASPADTGRIKLGPGETLVGYTDVSTGKYVSVSSQPTTTVKSRVYTSPVPAWSTEHVVIQSQPAAVTEYREVAVQPVLKTTTRRGLFGRQVSTCRMVNGKKVCN